MATTFGKRSCAYDVLGMEESLSAPRRRRGERVECGMSRVLYYKSS